MSLMPLDATPDATLATLMMLFRHDFRHCRLRRLISTARCRFRRSLFRFDYYYAAA